MRLLADRTDKINTLIMTMKMLKIDTKIFRYKKKMIIIRIRGSMQDTRKKATCQKIVLFRRFLITSQERVNSPPLTKQRGLYQWVN
jgi:hypothetical protein